MKKPILSFVAAIVFLVVLEFASRAVFRRQGLTWTETIAAQAKMSPQKKPGERRLFVFGASSVVGYHHLGRSSLSTALQALLADNEEEWRVLNFGKAGEGSEFIFDAATQSLAFDPDVVIVYAGENEFAPIPILRGHFRFRLERWLLNFKLTRLLKHAKGLPAVPSIPDFRRYGASEILQQIQRDRGKIQDHFKKRIERFYSRLNRNTTFFFISPAINMAWGPSFHDDIDQLEFDLSDPAARDFIRGVIAQRQGDLPEAARRFQQSIRTNSDSADSHFRLGEILRKLGDESAAAREFIVAIASDPSPRRLSPSLSSAVTSAPNFVWIDFMSALLQIRRAKILDCRFIEDDCHPTVASEYALASLIVDTLQKKGIASRSEGQFADYLAAMKMDPRAMSDIDLRIASYHNGRGSASYWLENAKNEWPENPALKDALAKHKAKLQSRSDRLDSTLFDLRTRLLVNEASQ